MDLWIIQTVDISLWGRFRIIHGGLVDLPHAKHSVYNKLHLLIYGYIYKLVFLDEIPKRSNTCSITENIGVHLTGFIIVCCYINHFIYKITAKSNHNFLELKMMFPN